ncbi:MAG: hypothetical protein ACRC80_29505, partial [Waterburya sp.]
LRLTNNQSEPIINSFFNSSEKANLLLQLKLQIKKLKNNCEQENPSKLSEKLEPIVQHIVRQVKENFISDEYDDLTPNYFLNFQFNAHNLRNKTIQNFQDYLSNHWQTAAPQNLLSCLGNLERVLNQRHQQYQKAKKQYLNKVNTVWRTYLYLEERIKKNYLLKKTSKKIYTSHDWQSIWNALYYVCEDKIHAEICDLSSELICKLLEQTKIYLYNLKQTDNLLEELQEYFEQHSDTPISSNYIRQKINAAQFRKSLEASTGHSLNQWGVSEQISAQIIRERLLVELSPIAQSIYTQFYQEVFSVVDTNNLIDDN